MPSNIPATTIRIDPEVKKEATAILDELGLSMSTAVNAFLRALVREGGMPFEMRVKTPAPDGETGRRRDSRQVGLKRQGQASSSSGLGRIAPLPDSDPARGRPLCNRKEMMGRNVNPGLTEPFVMLSKRHIASGVRGLIPTRLSQSKVRPMFAGFGLSAFAMTATLILPFFVSKCRLKMKGGRARRRGVRVS